MSIKYGLDIGTSKIRIAILQEKKGIWHWIDGSEISRLDEAGKTQSLDLFWNQIREKLKNKTVTVSNSQLNYMMKYITQIHLPEDRLLRFLEMELTQHNNSDGNISADYYSIPIDGHEKVYLIPLTQAEQSDALLESLKQNKIKIDTLQLPLAASFNAINPPCNEELETETTLIAEIGCSTTRLMLVRDGNFLACRIIPLGGNTFTEALAKEKGLTLEQAEKLKKAHSSKPNPKTEFIGMEEVNKETEDELDLDTDLNLETDFLEKDSVNNNDQSNDSSIIDDFDDLFDDEELDLDTDTIPIEKAEDKKLELDTDNMALEKDDYNLELELDLDLDATQVKKEKAPTTSLHAKHIANDSIGMDDLFQSDDEDTNEFKNSLDEIDIETPTVNDPGINTMAIAKKELSKEMITIAENLYMQINGSTNWFKAQLHSPKLKIDQILLSGGGSRLSGLDNYLSNRFKKDIFVANESFITNIQGDTPENLSDFTTAIGLAMNNKENAISFNLCSKNYQKKHVWKTDLIFPRIAAILIGIATIIMIISMLISHSSTKESITALKENKKSYNKQKTELENLQTKRDYLQEDLRGIASRIFAGRDLLHTIKALKEKAPRTLWVTDFRTLNLSSDSTKKKEKREDTSIDKGRIVILGKVKPDKQGVKDRTGALDLWAETISNWKPDGTHKLFSKMKKEIEIETQDDTGNAFNNADFLFKVTLDFEPTNIKEIIFVKKGGK